MGDGEELVQKLDPGPIKMSYINKKLIATSERVKISAQNFDSNYTRSLLLYLGSRLRGLNLLTC